MPCRTPESIARKYAADNARKKAKRIALRGPVVIVQKPSPNRLTFKRPAMPDMSKAELRAMLAQAMANTAAL